MFCRKCGEKLPENAKFCTKCGMSIQGIDSNEAQLNQNTMNLNTKPKKRFWPMYLKLIGIACLIFFIPLIIEVILSANEITINETIKYLVAFIQVYIPIFLIDFGWIPVLIYVKSQ